MTALCLAGRGQAADLAAYLTRLLRWDRAAVVRAQAAGQALAVFGRAPFGAGVLAVRMWELAGPAELDATVSAGQLLDAIDEDAERVVVPAEVTGPSWAGLLPPRAGWRRLAELDETPLREAAAAVVAEFRQRTEALPPERRTRVELDALAEEIWSRRLDGTPLPLRAVHAAHALGFLRPVPALVPERPGAASGEGPVLFSAGRWLRLRTGHGSVAIRRENGPGLAVTPLG